MKIIADEKIPYIREYFPQDNVVLLPGRQITASDLHDADALIVRSVTPVNRDLLIATPVKYVATVTSGFDHLDLAWLNDAGITSFVAEGCNSTAVVDYVLAVVTVLQRQKMLPNKPVRAGIIGAGKIGARVVSKLKQLGFEVMAYDPFLADKAMLTNSLDDFYDLDLISLHTPLTISKPHATYHMIDEKFLRRQKAGCVLLNTSRGSVIDFADLKRFGTHMTWCLDVWENEPKIDLSILDKCFIATPHIAGHTVQSKQRGIDMVYQNMCELNLVKPVSLAPPLRTKVMKLQHPIAWQELLLSLYDPLSHTEQMKDYLQSGDVKIKFDWMRNRFNERFELDFVKLEGQ